MTDPRRLAERVLRMEAAGILAQVERLDETFDQAVDLLHGCRGRVIVSGMGKSGLVGRKIAATLASTGTPAYFLHPAEGGHGDLGIVARDDVILMLSNSGETNEMLAILPPLKRLVIPIVLLTGNPRSTLALQSDVVLDVGVSEEACPMNLAPTSSTTATLAMGDALAMALLDRRGLKPEDYAALHPGGSLGWRALFRVRDLMRTGDEIPVVSEHALLKDVVEEMTRTRFGITTIVDAAGRLIGVFTDGDLRRLHLTGAAGADARAADVAMREPKLVGADELATTALEIMERFQITSLVVVDETRHPSGLIRMHDILRAKIGS